MKNTSPKVDAYIDDAPEFARPILKRLRKLIHKGCPQIVETIKWGHPFFEHKGVLCSMAAFKAHCAFGFWHSEMARGVPGKSSEAMGQFGRITRLSDLPKRAELEALIHRWQTARLLDEGVPYLEIAERVPTSTATVTRVAQWVKHGTGGYRTALARAKRR